MGTLAKISKGSLKGEGVIRVMLVASEGMSMPSRILCPFASFATVSAPSRSLIHQFIMKSEIAFQTFHVIPSKALDEDAKTIQSCSRPDT